MLIAGEKLREQAYQRTLDEIENPKNYIFNLTHDKSAGGPNVISMAYARRHAKRRLEILENLNKRRIYTR